MFGFWEGGKNYKRFSGCFSVNNVAIWQETLELNSKLGERKRGNIQGNVLFSTQTWVGVDSGASSEPWNPLLKSNNAIFFP